MPICKHCLVEKATRLPFSKSKRATFPLHLIRSNICGPMNVRARHDAHYFITFVDDFTIYGHVYLISHKFEAMDCFLHYNRLVVNEINMNIKALLTDRGHQYVSDLFKSYYDDKGIGRQLTISSTWQQNDIVERRNETILDMVRSIMTQANLPISF